MRGYGITKDEKDYCGQWKGRKRKSDCFDDVELPWVDAKKNKCTMYRWGM